MFACKQSVRAMACTVAVSILMLPVSPAQSQPEFEAAVIRVSTLPANQGSSTQFYPGRLVATNISLKDLIRATYLDTPQEGYRVVGGPGWIDSSRYDINAVGSPPNATEPELRIMLRNLLADRFKLTYHTETRDTSVIALVVRKGGPKLRPAQQAPPDGNTEMGPGGLGMSPMFQKIGLRDYARWMSGSCATLDFRPVIDMTGLEGEFDLRMETQPLDDGIRRTFVDQLCENVSQLGLELRRQNVPTLFYVIDSAERTPAEN